MTIKKNEKLQLLSKKAKIRDVNLLKNFLLHLESIE